MSSSGSCQQSISMDVSQTFRGRNDIAWEHVNESVDENGKKILTCIYYGKIIRGGGIYRVKLHLAGIKGEVGKCSKVPFDVKFKIEEALNEIRAKNKQKVELRKNVNPYGASVQQFEGDMLDEDQESEEVSPYNSHRSLINFLVYCPKGVCFVKSVDASDVVKDATTLFRLFEEIALWVRPNNIVHLVTDNGANYKVARRMLSEKYSSITWSPCAAHCINLMLKDIAEMSHIVNLSKRASEVTKFVYNHSFVLALLRKKQVIYLYLVLTDRTFVESRYAKTNEGKAFISIVLDNRFWDDIGIITKVVSPLMRMLNIVDSDVRPSIGYVYDGMYRTRMGIKKLFKNKKGLYKPYTIIIKMCWDRMLRHDIHAVAYYLNPAFKYDDVTFSKKPEVMYGFLDTIDNKASAFKMSKTMLLEESRLYRDRLESISRELALQTCKTTLPDEWWRTFGFSAPNLQKSCCKKITYDPVDYESIDKTEWWIVDEKDEVGELNYDELEQSLYEEGAIPVDGGDHPSYYDSTDASEDDVANVTNDDDHLWDDM
ncbi:uncharacterized protein LOC116111996 [Pistacia vera]|uniref:uncharacterized protein LOC116111996 n=1 Tax=Pistacia vera TaxID=55513 RepID=UPI001262BCAC|nr:uncharacterized protein LOC116111996 [Pistacia vera]